MYNKNPKASLLERVPRRSMSAARGAAVGAGIGAVIGRKEAMAFAAVGSYVGMRLGEAQEQYDREELKQKVNPVAKMKQAN